MKIATAGSRTSKRWRTQDMSWDAFLAKLRTPMRTGETFAEYQRMDKAEKAKKKEAAGGFVGGAMSGGRRIAGAVTERWLVTLDADEAREGDWDNAEALADFAMAVYSTHSHSHDHPRLRWIIPLRAPVSREQYQPLARMLALELGILETLDASTYQPERLMYWPTAAADGEYVEHELEGPILDPASILARYGSGDAWKDSSLWPIASREKEIVLREVKTGESDRILTILTPDSGVISAAAKGAHTFFSNCSRMSRTVRGTSTHAAAERASSTPPGVPVSRYSP